MYVDISSLVGETLVSVEGLSEESEEIHFYLSSGKVYRMFHSQDCCESVEVYSVDGDVADIIGTPIVEAVEVSSEDYAFMQFPHTDPDGIDSHTWTFYKIDTNKGGVTIRWFGTSNGYYSESVEIEDVMSGQHPRSEDQS